MKLYIHHSLSKLFCPIAVACLCVCCGHDDGHDELKHDHSHHSHADNHHDEDSEDHAHGEIVLHPSQADKFGVETDTIFPGVFSEVLRVTGQILDNPSSTSVVSAPTAGVVKFVNGMVTGQQVSAGSPIASITASGVSGGDRNVADKAALQAAKRELDRLTPLYKEKIVSAKDYNTALQAYEQAKALYSPAAATGTAKALTSGAVTNLLVSNGEYVEAGTVIATIGDNRQLTLRADVPDRYLSRIPMIRDARIVVSSTGQIIDLSESGGKRITGTPSSRVSAGYIPVFFGFNSSVDALPSTLADVYLIGTPRKDVVSVPIAAITEQQGNHFVYTRLDEDCYEKIPVTLGQSDGKRIEVIAGLKGGECVVVKGASAIRLAETSSVTPEGHSHQH